MSVPFSFQPVALTPAALKLRGEVRDFLAEERETGSLRADSLASTAGFDPDFSRKLGAKGWLGLTWPKQYGGHERSFLERFVLVEELLAARAPVWAHFVADRQSGPVLISFAQERVRESVVPRIARGELSFCIGMSEPESGSDLFAAKSKATRTNEGWRLKGRKVWTTMAHRCDYMIGLFRTSAATEKNRRHGLSQFLIDLKSPGISIRPILFPDGTHDFNEVTFDDVDIPDDHLLGDVDQGWRQVTSELAFERSGPERYLDTAFILSKFLALTAAQANDRIAVGLGHIVADLHTFRQMGLSISAVLDRGEEPVLEASIFKEAATIWEQHLPNLIRDLADGLEFGTPARADFDAALLQATMNAPKLTIQGGTVEILRGIIARGLGLR